MVMLEHWQSPIVGLHPRAKAYLRLIFIPISLIDFYLI